MVTDQFSCERIIKAAKELTKQNNTLLYVVNICNQANNYNSQAIDFLFRIAVENESKMMVYYSDTPASQLNIILRDQLPVAVVTGMPGNGSSFLQIIWKQFQDINFYTVDFSGNLNSVTYIDTLDR